MSEANDNIPAALHKVGDTVYDPETPGVRWRVESLPEDDAQGLLGLKLWKRGGRLSSRTFYCRPHDVQPGSLS